MTAETPAPAGAPDRCPTCNSADPTVTLRGFSPGGSGGVDRCDDPWHSAAPVCSTCDGTGLVDWAPGQIRDTEDDQQPCPDCDSAAPDTRPALDEDEALGLLRQIVAILDKHEHDPSTTAVAAVLDLRAALTERNT